MRATTQVLSWGTHLHLLQLRGLAAAAQTCFLGHSLAADLPPAGGSEAGLGGSCVGPVWMELICILWQVPSHVPGRPPGAGIVAGWHEWCKEAGGWARCGSPGHCDPACHLKGQRIPNRDLPPRPLLRAAEHLPGALFKCGR